MGNSEGRYGAVEEAGNANTIVIASSKFLGWRIVGGKEEEKAGEN